jgi:hypothetical protein
MIKKGSCWKVGNGQTINIWDDNWVIWQNGFKILTPNNGHSIAKVSEIMDNSPKCWNSSTINQIFYPFESTIIHQIPLIKESDVDQLMWPHAKEGRYTVKSGYNLLKLWQDTNGPNSSTNNNQNLWKNLWNLQTIPRHKMLIWRIIQRALPVRSELNNRGVACTVLCPRCFLKEETIEHTFMLCPHATKVWFGSKLGIKFDQQLTNFPDWLAYAISTLKEEDVIYMVAIIYGIWYARNQKIFEDRDIEGHVTIESANTSIQEYQQALHATSQQGTSTRSSNSHRQRPSSNTPKHWFKPNQGVIKVNSDANLANPDRWGLGATFRDCDGELIAAATWKVPGANEPLLAEAFALYKAMTLAIECCFQVVEFESDNKRLVQLINLGDNNPNSYVGSIVWGINCIKHSFRSCIVRHINRQANKASHCMAQLAHSEPNKVWIEETPSQLVNVLIRDLIH